MAFPDGTADFRSDTVTRPTPEMRRAMAAAEVGDDVYGDDPTVNLLEEESAAVVGKEAAVFVPSGTMGNQLAVMTQTAPGEEVICDEGAHVRNVERGAASALSGVAFRTVPAEAGCITSTHVDEAMVLAGRFFPRIRLLVWENSHNLSGGRVVPVETMADTNAAARRHGLSIHLDGARIFNAALALGVSAAELAAGVDTVQFCFSKGLGAPVGSILCGPADLIAEARYLRKRLGGGMRQVGILAAAGLVAPWMAAIGMSAALGVPYAEIADLLSRAGIKANAPFAGNWRLVTHRDVDRADVDRLLDALPRPTRR